MTQTIFQIDAFADGTFMGNPAAVCPVFGWLPCDLMLSIASENNLSETALVPNKFQNSLLLINFFWQEDCGRKARLIWRVRKCLSLKTEPRARIEGLF